MEAFGSPGYFFATEIVSIRHCHCAVTENMKRERITVICSIIRNVIVNPLINPNDITHIGLSMGLFVLPNTGNAADSLFY